jgi:hypothetical protein
MKELPEDLASMDRAELAVQRDLRDDLLARLFVRWPALSRIEMRLLKKVYRETVRIARHRGESRLRTPAKR